MTTASEQGFQYADLDWQNLGFQYLPTNGYVRVDYANGAWGEAQWCTDPYVSLHIAANCLHYGQAIFEGLKAFTRADGTVAMFRPEQNARRMAASAVRLCMEPVPEALFLDACRQAVAGNREFVPPYGTGASMYVRPVMFGTEAMVGINASATYTFLVLVTPVGPYYKNGFKPLQAITIDQYDRAAPQGTGRAKCAGNYAASLLPYYTAKHDGYSIVLFTDPIEHKYVDEFGTSNFLGITPAGEYKTPLSTSILQSVTNDSLQTLAQDLGLTVVREQIPVAGLDQFSEVGACGTAAVITPISAVVTGARTFTFGDPAVAGETLTRLYKELQGIQYGDIADRYGWMLDV
jgi:branched-chain amino acid aminotransferase